ncbi:hypothetical protein [Ralstonia solanacearum]|uniref:hypothetical protein n=2 Tax=Ralstonia solanacearum TaxID=305 RepID=UPI000A8094AE|nr:hypothetical protein [Ralstonia solanacearum]
MDPVDVHYIPATTRAAMALLGISLKVELENKIYELSPKEMPGEAAWRADFLRWLARKTFHRLAALPKEEWVSNLLKVEESLITQSGLHTFEAQAVTEGALATIMEQPPARIATLRSAQAYFDAVNESEGEKLGQRYVELVRQHARRPLGDGDNQVATRSILARDGNA